MATVHLTLWRLWPCGSGAQQCIISGPDFYCWYRGFETIIGVLGHLGGGGGEKVVILFKHRPSSLPLIEDLKSRALFLAMNCLAGTFFWVNSHLIVWWGSGKTVGGGPSRQACPPVSRLRSCFHLSGVTLSPKSGGSTDMTWVTWFTSPQGLTSSCWVGVRSVQSLWVCCGGCPSSLGGPQGHTIPGGWRILLGIPLLGPQLNFAVPLFPYFVI